MVVTIIFGELWLRADISHCRLLFMMALTGAVMVDDAFINNRGKNELHWWSTMEMVIGLAGGEDYNYPIPFIPFLSDQRWCCKVLTLISNLLIIFIRPGLVLADTHFIAHLSRPGRLPIYHWWWRGFLKVRINLIVMVTKANMGIILMISVSAWIPELLRRASSYDPFFRDWKGLNWLPNDCGPVHVR